MRDILIMLLWVAMIIDVFGLFLGYPASEQKMQFVFGLNFGCLLAAVIYLIFGKGEKNG